MFYSDLTVTGRKNNKQAVLFSDLTDNRTGDSLPSFDNIPFAEPSQTKPMTIISDETTTGFNIFMEKIPKGVNNVDTIINISE